MKANLMIIRGRKWSRITSEVDWRPLPRHAEWAYECEVQFISESFTRLESLAYSRMRPLTIEGGYYRGDSTFEMVFLVPGKSPVRTTVQFSRGCNCLSMPEEFARLVPPEFFDPIQAMQYALEHGLEQPPFFDITRKVK